MSCHLIFQPAPHTHTHSAFTSTGNKKKKIDRFFWNYSEIILPSPTSLEPKPFLKHSTVWKDTMHHFIPLGENFHPPPSLPTTFIKTLEGHFLQVMFSGISWFSLKSIYWIKTFWPRPWLRAGAKQIGAGIAEKEEEGPISHPTPLPPRPGAQGPPHPPPAFRLLTLFCSKNEMDNVLSSHHQPQGLQTSPQPLCWAGSFRLHAPLTPSPPISPFPLVGFFLCTSFCALDFGILRCFLELLRQDSKLSPPDQFPSCSSENRLKGNSPSRPSSWYEARSSLSEQNQDPSILSPPRLCFLHSGTRTYFSPPRPPPQSLAQDGCIGTQ